jgi:penicillin-binding protein 1C
MSAADAPPGPARRRPRRAVLLAALLGTLAVLALALSAALWAAAGADSGAALPAYRQARLDYRASDVRILDRDGALLQRVRLDYRGRRGDWIELRDISPALQRAVILSEDRRFYRHAGVDWQAVAAAAWGNLWHARRRGASTISMQLVAMLEPGYRRGRAGRTLRQKLDQAMQARRLERRWSKPQILEAYLNLAAFRGELVGVDALSRVLFGKHPSGLDAREAALTAVLLRGPNAPAGVLRRRTCRLLGEMGAGAECAGLAGFVRSRLERAAAPLADTDSLAPQFARWLLQRHPAAAGQALRTSIDGRLQRYVLDSVDRNVRALRDSNVRDAAVVVLDNRSGQVLAYVGSSGPLLSLTPQVDNARSRRQAGSTLKPFLYAQALQQERLTAVSLLDDAPLNLPTGNGLYIPRNYDNRFSGWVSVRTALASSLNIPAVRTLVMVTPDAFQQQLLRLGLPLDHSGDYYGYSLALGSADITLLSLTNAYRALANEGLYSDVRLLPAAPAAPWSRVYTRAAAWVVGDILSDRHARARTFGMDSPLTTPFWTAVKTGTSKDMRDNWTVGWSRRYTVGVWVGNGHGDSMRNVSGVSGAGPIWHDVMAHLESGASAAEPAMPPGVSRRRVSFDEGIEPDRSDVFIGDTGVDRVRLGAPLMLAEAAALRIAQPVDGTILALDPDIPALNQKVWLRAAGLAGQAGADVRWRVDGKVAGSGAEMPWAPWPGRHTIELLDGKGAVRDRAAVEVRGAVLRQAAAR